MTNETVQRFETVAREAFAFLVDEHGYVRLPLPSERYVNPFEYRLSNGTLTLVVEGINWGLNAWVRLEDEHGRSVPIDALMPGWQPFGMHGKKNRRTPVKSQDEQIIEAAQHLKDHGQDVLRGDLTRFNEIGNRIDHVLGRFRQNLRGEPPPNSHLP